ncbi:hypothetical protein QBC42DRAFT_307497 [Cladorrhinum samala]|uniref:gamma-glutamylcyclotransferase n=1 Tax=Cladorrhinum samala TaxID=585594 RepID=A0AAV9HGC8_9PEZI|nr:hypothetical protein QBC42DRAFT_307497 [Cladorrhinum samala]
MTSQQQPGLKAYFGYGSNLWLDQMSRRCPSSPHTGIGLLRGYQWFINSRGYANIAASDNPDDQVWGLIYDLTPEDEAQLDVNEGVPVAYEKRTMPVLFAGKGERGEPKDAVDMLVYIDFQRNEGKHKPRAEYVHRMNMGIRDALKEGVPQEYVDKVLREYIPEEDELGVEQEQVKKWARKQAERFRDESGVITPTSAAGGSGVE